MFNITENKGFHLTFANGWTVSVQWGTANYCDNRSMNYDDSLKPAKPSTTAEIAAWDANGKWFDFGNDNVKGHVSADDVSVFIVGIASMWPSNELIKD